MTEEAVRLNRLYDAYAEKGFKLLVISPHKVSELREELVEKHKAKYWIGCDSNLRTTVGYVIPNVPAEFPMTYLVDSRGKIVDHGDKLETKIESLLEEVFDPELKRAVHPALKSARRYYDKGDFGAAWKLAGKKTTDEDEALAADAKFLRGRCEAYGAWKQRMLQREIDAGAYPTVIGKLKLLEKSFRGMPTAAWAKKTRTALGKDPKVKVELEAWARLQKALAKAEKARGDRKKMRSVLKELKAIADKYPGTLAGKEAERQLLLR